MKNIKTEPICECGGQLCINALHIDRLNCLYILDLDCIMCGENCFIILSLEDFIDLEQKLRGIQ